MFFFFREKLKPFQLFNVILAEPESLLNWFIRADFKYWRINLVSFSLLYCRRKFPPYGFLSVFTAILAIPGTTILFTDVPFTKIPPILQIRYPVQMDSYSAIGNPYKSRQVTVQFLIIVYFAHLPPIFIMSAGNAGYRLCMDDFSIFYISGVFKLLVCLHPPAVSFRNIKFHECRGAFASLYCQFNNYPAHVDV